MSLLRQKCTIVPQFSQREIIPLVAQIMCKKMDHVKLGSRNGLEKNGHIFPAFCTFSFTLGLIDWTGGGWGK